VRNPFEVLWWASAQRRRLTRASLKVTQQRGTSGGLSGAMPPPEEVTTFLLCQQLAWQWSRSMPNAVVALHSRNLESGRNTMASGADLELVISPPGGASISWIVQAKRQNSQGAYGGIKQRQLMDLQGYAAVRTSDPVLFLYNGSAPPYDRGGRVVKLGASCNKRFAIEGRRVWPTTPTCGTHSPLGITAVDLKSSVLPTALTTKSVVRPQDIEDIARPVECLCSRQAKVRTAAIPEWADVLLQARFRGSRPHRTEARGFQRVQRLETALRELSLEQTVDTGGEFEVIARAFPASYSLVLTTSDMSPGGSSYVSAQDLLEHA
jgi:hypothetical protein